MKINQSGQPGEKGKRGGLKRTVHERPNGGRKHIRFGKGETVAWEKNKRDKGLVTKGGKGRCDFRITRGLLSRKGKTVLGGGS